MKIKIYAPDEAAACVLAANLNLALRHWEYAGASRYGTHADVGTVMDEYQELQYRMEGLQK